MHTKKGNLKKSQPVRNTYKFSKRARGKYLVWLNITTLMLLFLFLYHPDGTKRIADSTLVALTLMIAESRTEEKDVMVKVVVNLINKNNDE
jgi:hypothetical protein